MELLDSFLGLPRASRAGAFSVGRDEGTWRIGRSFDGHPALLVSLAIADGAKIERRLANLVYTPPAPVAIHRAGHSEAAHLAILECATNDRTLVGYFLRVVTDLLVPEAETGEESRFEGALDAIITLFKALQRPGSHTIQGLWTELALIVCASKPLVALSAWHSSPHALHDFAAGHFRLEAKSTLKQMREHKFLLDQLALGQPGHVLVASMLLTETSGGVSVLGLVELIRGRIGAQREPLRRLETIVADSLGISHQECDDHRFDLQRAEDSLRFYRANQIPTCPLPLPEVVKDVSFTVDLSTTPPLALAEARNLAPFFADVLPPT